MWGTHILDKTLKIHKINVYSIASEFDIFSQAWICYVYVYYINLISDISSCEYWFVGLLCPLFGNLVFDYPIFLNIMYHVDQTQCNL